MHGSKIYDTIIITMIIILALNNRLSIVAVENVQSENDLSVVLLVLATVHACPRRPTTSSFSAPNMQPAYTPFSSRKEKCSMPSIVMCIHIKVLEVLLHAHQGVVMLLHVATAVSWCDEACYCGLHGFTRYSDFSCVVIRPLKHRDSIKVSYLEERQSLYENSIPFTKKPCMQRNVSYKETLKQYLNMKNVIFSI
jgi:hypothetical protein